MPKKTKRRARVKDLPDVLARLNGLRDELAEMPSDLTPLNFATQRAFLLSSGILDLIIDVNQEIVKKSK